MLFNSREFFYFFPLVVLVYFLLPRRNRWVLLLASSYYFYMAWKAEYAIIIAISTLIDYYASRQMGREPDKKRRRRWLYLSLVSNLGILMTFKYYNFFAENVDAALSGLGIGYSLPVSELLLPMGISFYTFQTMAYSIDVYNERIKPEKHFGYFALYVTYFPQLVAGPIERAQNLLPEFRKHVEFKYSRVVSGLKQMVWGLFKKIVIADNIGYLVDVIYNSPADQGGLAVALGTVLFAFQIYCDFSGYSDIAIGASRVLGIKLMDNFRTPYLSKSISEFWSRWHISLSTWFRDYLYIPLGGSRVIKFRYFSNLMIVFLVSGFWHGSKWTFILWGALHGLYLVSAIVLNNPIQKVFFNEAYPALFKKVLNIAITFALVCFAWIFFRANSADDAFTLIGNMSSLDVAGFKAFIADNGGGRMLIYIGVLLGFILLDPFMDKVIKGDKTIKRPIAFGVYGLLLALIVLIGNFGEVSFIYFQF
jgi:alginate O-acetyltransferase complex protein AlgI